LRRLWRCTVGKEAMSANAKPRLGKKEDEREQEVIATKLCAEVYRNGKVDGRFQMPLEYVRVKTGLTLTATVTGLRLAELRDWAGLNRRGNVTLKAAGIYVAKDVLGLPR
jgi:hypothetical protein